MNKRTITIIIPCYNEEGNVSRLYMSLRKYLPAEYEAEIIFVDDGSADGTLAEIKKLSKKVSQVKFLSFTRNFGHQHALKAGLDFAKGSAVISLDGDGQHPPRIIPQMLKLWEKGYRIVYTRRTLDKKTGVIKNLTSVSFYKLINSLSETKLDEGAADFRLLDREVVDFIRSNPESALFLRGLVAWSGYSSIGIDYQPEQRAWGKTKYNYSRMMRLAIDAITSFSILPLRFATMIGIFMSVFSGIYGLYAVLAWIFDKPSVITGWPSVIISVLFIGGLQLMILGILGEYIGKIFLETKRRPLYLIKEKHL